MKTVKKIPGRPRVHAGEVRRITLLVDADDYDRLAAYKRHKSAAENRDVSFARVLLDALEESKKFKDWRRTRR